MPSTPSSSRSSRSKSSSAARPDEQPEPKLSLLLLLVAANQRMAQLVELELAADGVESNGYAMLSLIGVRGPVRLTEVAAELGLPLTTASDVMRRLEARRYVRRTPNPEDGRSFLFELSARGDREWRRGWGALQRINAALLAQIDEQQSRAVLEGLNRAFEATLTGD
jgi:DNA-binding MarR family transcriptional regulator